MSSQTIDETKFTFTHIPGARRGNASIKKQRTFKQEFKIRRLSGGTGTFGSGNEEQIFYRIDFEPPLNIDSTLHCVILYIGPAGQKGSGISLSLFSKDIPSEDTEFGDTRKFRVYDTHQLEFFDEGSVAGCYIVLENNQLYSKDSRVQLEIGTDLGIGFFREKFKERYSGLDFIPPDPDLLEITKGGLDSRIVPQRTPLFWKLRAEISGSTLSKLLGFYVKSKDKDPDWSWWKKEPFSEWNRSIMRLGRLRETFMIIAYLTKHPQSVFYESGSIPHPKNPDKWSASPDGLVQDPVRGDGVLEFKASRKDADMKGYYYPQVYFEMGAAEVEWGDLVRYLEKGEYDTKTKRYQKRVTIVTYPIKLEPMIEASILRCVARAWANLDTLQDIVYEKEFVDLRTLLETTAKNTPPTDIMTPQAAQLMQEFEHLKMQVQKVDAPEQQPLSELEEIAQGLLDYANRLLEISSRNQL